MPSDHFVDQQSVLCLLYITLCLAWVGDAGADTSQAGSIGSALIPASRFRSLVIVSTLDGQITALDAGAGKGRVLWSVPSPSGPLFSSSLGNVEFKDRSGAYRLIPALDGNLYSWRGGKLKAVPADLDSLFTHSDTTHDGSSLVGAKDKLSYGVDPDTGELHYVCSVNGCQLHDEGPDTPLTRTDVLVIKRLQRTIRAFNERHGFETWNVSVGEVDISLEEGNELNEDLEFCQGTDAVHDWHLRLSASDGIVLAYSQTAGDLLWRHQLSSPVANVWTLKGTCLQSWDMFQEKMSLSTVQSVGSQPNPSLYLGSHRSQMYIQTSASMTIAMHAWVRAGANAENYARKLLLEQSSKAGTGMRPLLSHITGIDTPLQLEHGAGDNAPQFLLSSDRANLLAIPAGRGKGDSPSLPADKPTTTELILKEPIGPGSYFYHTLPLQVCDSLSNDKLCFPPKKAVKPPHRPHPFQVDTSLAPHMPLIMVLMLISVLSGMFGYRYYLKRKVVLDIVVKELAESSNSREIESQSSKEESTEGSPSSDKAPELFQSRFSNDFEKIKTLGKGGFGVVFQVRQRFDEQQYAVKRVMLREGVDSKVMREVNALATLEHQNIVRYFNSWVEEPPLGHSFDELDGEDEEADDEDWDEDESNDELCDAVGDLVSRTSDGASPLRHFHARYSMSYPSDNDSSGGIIFGDSSAASSPDSSHRMAMLSEGSSSAGSPPPRSLSSPSPSPQPVQCRSRTSTLCEAEGGANIESTAESTATSKISSTISSTISADEGVTSPSTGLFVSLQGTSSRSSSELDTPQVAASSIMALRNGFAFSGRDDSSSSGVEFGTMTDDSYTSVPADDDQHDHRARQLHHSPIKSDVRFSVSPRMSLDSVPSLGIVNGIPLPLRKPMAASLLSESASTRSVSDVTDRTRTKSRRRRRYRTSMSEQSDAPRVYLYIQMQLCQEMDLKDWLTRHITNRCLQEATKIFLQIVRAVGYVHDNKLMHRDLKPSNVFFSHTGRVKVGDFGLATASGHNRNMSRDDLHALACEFDSDDEGEHTGQVGTEIYMSPELMKGQKYCHKVDIFSLGIMFFELLCPFDTQMERMHILVKVRKHRFPQDFSEKRSDVVRQLLAVEPCIRPTARELYQNPIFKDIIAEEAAEGGW